MTEDFSHYITKNIQSFYKRRIIPSILFLSFLIIINIIYPITSIALPTHLNSSDNIKTAYEQHERFVAVNLKKAYFTGYRKYWLGKTTGYYYYSMLGDECVILILSPDTCQQGISTLSNITVRAQILAHSRSQTKLLSFLAHDLSWSKTGINQMISPYVLSEPDATGLFAILLIIAYIFFFLYSLCNIILYAIYIKFPILSKPIQSLRTYGKPQKILEQAEEELATLPQLATEDMFITKHYFIETSNYGVAIVPINSIIWIYKYSTLHKFLWHHFSISYTLYIIAKKRLYIRCPKNIKSDIDGIIDYLAEANHDILIGFDEENRKKVALIQCDFAFIEKFLSFLSKKL